MPVLITLICSIGLYLFAREVKHKQDSMRRKPIPVRDDEQDFYPRQ